MVLSATTNLVHFLGYLEVWLILLALISINITVLLLFILATRLDLALVRIELTVITRTKLIMVITAWTLLRIAL